MRISLFKYKTLLLLIFILLNENVLNCSCFQSSSTSVLINWDKTHQIIEGFGAFAGRAGDFYNDSKRNQIMEMLFGKSGLQLSIIRSTLFPDFDFTKTDFNDLTDEHKAEFWIMKTAKEIFGVNKFMSTAWSPPYQWKTIPGEHTGKYLNMLSFKHYQDFADYMVNFIKWYNRNGVELSVISPHNEPEFAAIWDSCIWFPSETANFVKNYLRPAIIKSNLTTKILIGESSNCLFTDAFFTLLSENLPEKNFDIYASHGYSLPNIITRTVGYDKQLNSFPIQRKYKNKDYWVTEASSTDNYDNTMKKGMDLAISLHNFLYYQNINSYIFWLSMNKNKSNEALIISQDNGKIEFPKIYDVYGQFTRYVKKDWTRVDTIQPVNNDLLVSMYKLSKKYSIVVINSSQLEIFTVKFLCNQFSIIFDKMEIYLTDETNRWRLFDKNKLGFNKINGHNFELSFPPFTVVTITGYIN